MPSVDRRTLLIGGGMGLGLIVGIAWWRGGSAAKLPVTEDEHRFGGWIKIARTGQVTVALPQVETGQGIWTALPQIVADELGADWRSIAAEPAPLAAAYRNRVIGDEDWFGSLGPLKAYRLGSGDGAVMTAGATSVRAFAAPLREAAAAARMMLTDAAADRLGVEADACRANDGAIWCGNQRLGFGELAEAAAARRPPRRPQLRSDEASRSRSLPRLDGPGKASGKTRFAADVRLPDLLYASVRLAPAGGRLSGFDRAALRRRGVRHVAARDGWIAIVAERWAEAEAALHAANPRFAVSAAPADPRESYQAALDGGEVQTITEVGDFAAAAADSRPVAASYFLAPTRHRSLEPLSATARAAGGTRELWLGTQAPGLGATAAGVAAEGLYPLPVGGPDGRALESPLGGVAIALAEAVGRPVQVMLPRSAERLAVPRGPGLLAEMSAVLRDDGLPEAWRIRAASSDGLSASLGRAAGGAPADTLGPQALRGALPPYAIAQLAVHAVSARGPFLAGYMRGSPEREFTFATESFVDELARRRGLEPLAFRMALLGAQPRLARCLQTAAALANWDGGAVGSNMGIAGAMAFGSAIGLVATASIDAAQQVRAHRLVAAIDCGLVINPGLAMQQVEAAMIWGLEAAGGIAGLASLPDILVRFLPSNAAPGGLSGLGALPIAPAVANAIHAATGKRMRSLPFDPMAA